MNSVTREQTQMIKKTCQLRKAEQLRHRFILTFKEKSRWTEVRQEKCG